MHISEFTNNTSARLSHVYETGEPTHVTRHGNEYVTAVPTEWWRRAEHALAFMEGMTKAGRDGREEMM